jgi:hypothetical protein
MWIYMSCSTQSHITAAGWETTSPMASWTQMWEDLPAATARRSDMEPTTWRFLYFSFVKILQTRLWISKIYDVLCWIVVDCGGICKFWLYESCGHRGLGPGPHPIGFSVNRQIYGPRSHDQTASSTRWYDEHSPLYSHITNELILYSSVSMNIRQIYRFNL